MQFGIKFFWEFIQNLPLIAGLMLALQFWLDESIVFSIAAMLTGSLLGAILIRLTENKIIENNHVEFKEDNEPIAVTFANFGLMFILMLALTAYITAVWSNIATDLIVGGLMGVLLSAVQSKAAGRAIGWRHSMAFATAFPTALIIIRFILVTFPAILSIILINTTVTLIITYIDYGHLSTIEEGAN